MIVDSVVRDIFEAPEAHIAFAVNTEGINDSGFAGLVARRHWPELAYVGPMGLGETITKVGDGKTFHALVCHSLGPGGWGGACQRITECLDALDIPEDETVAIVQVGGGPVGKAMGANVGAIREGMERSVRRVVVYSQ